jgi:hypothetical protein
MKWKRSKKAQQEAKARSSGDSKHKTRGDSGSSETGKNDSFGGKDDLDDDLDMVDDDIDVDDDIEGDEEEEEIDVGDREHKDLSQYLPHLSQVGVDLFFLEHHLTNTSL